MSGPVQPIILSFPLLFIYKHNSGQCYSHYACWLFVWIPLDIIPHIPRALRHSRPCRVPATERVAFYAHRPSCPRVFKWLVGGTRRASLKEQRQP